MKIINIKDLNKKILYLDRGEYLINGKRYSFSDYYNNKLEVEDLKELKKINITTITIGYYDELNQKEIDVKEYEKIKDNLLSKSYKDDEGDIYFNDLDDEYNYKKFVKTHKAIFKTIETISENIKLAEEVVVYKTGNKFIESAYFSECEDKEKMIYKYYREKAYIDIVTNKFDELGFDFLGNCSYNQTENKKVWGNSEHSGIRYVTAFGTYIFNDGFKLYSPVVRGTLEDMLSTYKEDKKLIEGIITRKYNEKFSVLNKDKLNQIPELVNELEYRLNKINPKKDSYSDYRFCKDKLNLIQKIISESFI